MANPGAEFPPGDDYLVREIRKLQRQQDEDRSARSLAASSIGAGGLTVKNGGSITIEGTGALNVGSGALNSAGSITAATNVTAGGTIQGGTVTATGGVSAGGNVSAGGQINSTLPVKSAGSYSYVAGSNRRTQWIDDSFQMGQTTSSVRYKRDFERMTEGDIAAFLSLQPIWGRYNWAEPDSAREAFLIAEDVAALDLFGQDVLVRDANGKPDGINYSQLAGPLLAICRAQQTQIHELSMRLATLDGGTVIPAPTDLPSAADQPVDDPVLDPNPPMA